MPLADKPNPKPSFHHEATGGRRGRHSNQLFTENSRCVHHEHAFIHCQHKNPKNRLSNKKLMLHVRIQDLMLPLLPWGVDLAQLRNDAKEFSQI